MVRLTVPSSISGPSASGFGRVRACLCARARSAPFSPAGYSLNVVGSRENFIVN